MEGWVLCESNPRLGLQAEKTGGDGRHIGDLLKCECIKKVIKNFSNIGRREENLRNQRTVL